MSAWPRACALPDAALLQRLREEGAYTDAYAVEVAAPVAHARFVEAFYTTWVFELERAVLAVAMGRPSTDAQARALAHGERDDFAAWRVEARGDAQVLLRDVRGRTCSWLMCEAVDGGTRLYFGSAVVPVRDPRSGQRALGPVFAALLGFHRLYSHVLLWAAEVRLRP
jgi:hypothetical protein